MRAVASLAPLSIVFLSLAPSPGAGAVPFSHFQALPDTQLAAVQVKLTPLGRRAHPIPSLVLMSPSGVPDLAAFAAGYRPGFVYGPSDSALITCRISVPELRAFLEAAARLPEVIDGDHSRLQSSAPPSTILDATGHGTSKKCSTLRRGMGVARVSEDVSATATRGDAAPPRIVTPPGQAHVDGPPDDPLAEDQALLHANRANVLAQQPALIIPGHGAPFAPSDT